MRVAAIALGLVGAVYLADGFRAILVGGLPFDLSVRWVENAYLLRGISSFDVFEGTVPVDPGIGRPEAGGYPPWSLPLSMLVAPPLSRELLQIHFALVNAIALVVILRFVQRAAAPYGTDAMYLVVAATLAMAANGVVLRNGQYGLIVNACLIGVVASLQTGRTGRAGGWLALAALKPQSSGPFGLLLLLSRARWRGVATVALVMGSLTALVAWWVDRTPMHLLTQVFQQAAHWELGDAGLLRVGLLIGVPRTIWIPVLAVGTLTACAWLLRVHRHRSWLVQMAIAAVAARLWTYHRRYDDVLLVFLLLPLALLALERRDRTHWGLFVLTGLTLWLPLREVDHTVPLITAKILVWVAGLTVLLRSEFGRAGDDARASA